jgi:tryptophan synthase alpha chain
MDNRYTARFRLLRQNNQKAFIPFTLLGWPDKELSLSIIKTMIDSGASMLELGWAFSDPIADGKIIQAAAFETLATGFKVEDALELIEQVRKYDADIPIGLLMYYNMLLAQGPESFFQQAATAGVDGVLVADLPAENAQEIIPHAQKNGIAPIFMVSPLTSAERLPLILQHAEGFLYLVSRLGITGTNDQYDQQLPAVLQEIRRQSDLPVCVGFGISQPQHARFMIDMGADGVITGSALIELIDKARASGDVLPALRTYLDAMRQATNPAV